jgi:GNAT superfamily N-acetyltransferase
VAETQIETTDVGRRETYAFLRAQIGNESVFKLIPTDAGMSSVVISARESGRIVGGIYVSPDFETMSGEQLSGLDTATRRKGWETMWALHGLAVDEGSRRHGLASTLVEMAEETARDQGAELITGVSVTGPDADAFYRDRGYEVGPLQWPLIFRFAKSNVLIKQDEPHARWFWKRLRNGGASAISPTEKQLAMYANAVENPE